MLSPVRHMLEPVPLRLGVIHSIKTTSLLSLTLPEYFYEIRYKPPVSSLP
jgi:hypothetical protein